MRGLTLKHSLNSTFPLLLLAPATNRITSNCVANFLMSGILFATLRHIVS